jgi:hypothetical protein
MPRVKQFTLQHKELTFWAELQHVRREYPDDPQTYWIRVGGPDKKCCALLVNTTVRTITIYDLFYNPACIVSGSGTAVLLNTALLFAIAQFSVCKVIHVQDEATFGCRSVEGRQGVISMADHNFVIYGKTWYQRRIPGLELILSPQHMQALESVTALLDSDSWKTNNPIQVFWVALRKIKPLSHEVQEWLSKHKSSGPYALLKQLYSESTTLSGFLQAIQTRLSRADVCKVFLELLPSVMKLLKLQSLRGVLGQVDANLITGIIDVQALGVQRGGAIFAGYVPIFPIEGGQYTHGLMDVYGSME